MIIDTHIALREILTFRWEGNTYWGTYTEEHSVNATAARRRRRQSGVRSTTRARSV